MESNFFSPRRLYLLLGVFLFSLSTNAQGLDCALFEKINSLKSHALTGSTILQRGTVAIQIQNNEGRIANQIFQQYITKKMPQDEMPVCLSKMATDQGFIDSIQTGFYRDSIDILGHSPGIVLNRLMAEYQKRYPVGSFPLFGLSGYDSEMSPTDERGGFDRGTGDVFADISRTTANDWLIIFVHELLHRIDDRIGAAATEYSKSEVVAKIASWANVKDDPSTLTSDQQEVLAKWVKAGLDRGFWAEYRAWYVTILIYKQGLKDGVWQNVSWIADALIPTDGNDLAHTIYRQLEARARPATSEVYKRPLVANALKNILDQVAMSGNLPPLWNLGDLVVH